jgi:hypothetical protein
MYWLILWLVLLLPVALLVGAFIAVGNGGGRDSESADHLALEIHEQTIVG